MSAANVTKEELMKLSKLELVEAMITAGKEVGDISEKHKRDISELNSKHKSDLFAKDLHIEGLVACVAELKNELNEKDLEPFRKTFGIYIEKPPIKPAISKKIVVEKLKDQKYIMKVNRHEIGSNGPGLIAGEEADVLAIKAEMCETVCNLLVNHMAGMAAEISVEVRMLN